MKCPRDKAAMIFSDDGKRMANRCAECSGLLLGAEEVGKALGDGSAAKRVRALPEGSLACPYDSARMRTLVHREVEIDLCPECGAMWLDAGELEKLRGDKARKGSRKAVLGAAALAAGAGAATVAAASQPAQGSFLGSVAESVGGVAVDGVVEVAIEFAGQALGALLEGIFS